MRIEGRLPERGLRVGGIWGVYTTSPPLVERDSLDR